MNSPERAPEEQARLESNMPGPPDTLLNIRTLCFKSGYRAALEDLREGRVEIEGYKLLNNKTVMALTAGKAPSTIPNPEGMCHN